MTLDLTEGEILEVASALRNEAHRMRQHAAPGIVSVLAAHAGTLERLAEKVLAGEPDRISRDSLNRVVMDPR